jgi:hypothetical protein
MKRNLEENVGLKSTIIKLESAVIETIAENKDFD